MLNFLRHPPVPIAVCIFIDGLDEFEGESDRVVDMITKLAEQTHVKVCVSSRPLLAFEKAFSGKPSLKLQDLTFDSLSEYAEDKLSKLIEERVSLEEHDGHRTAELLDSIVERADGVFLWAIIVIRDVRDGLREFANMNELAQMIESLPSELEDLFMHMLKKIKPAYQRDAVQYLQLVLYSTLDMDTIVSSRYKFDLCTLYFSHSQRESRDTPFVYEEIATSELVAACHTLKTRLVSHTAGLLELTPAKFQDHCYYGIYGKNQEHGPILTTHVNFLHRTFRDFLLNNAKTNSGFAVIDSTEAQVRLSIARGILAQVAHFSQGHDKVVETIRPNPVHFPILASLQHISLAERIHGAAQEKLMRSLDFATFTQVQHVSNHHSKPQGIQAYMIEYNSMDLVGMAAAAGMTFYVCEQLNIPVETRIYSPCLPDPYSYSRNKCTAATISWNEGHQSQDPGSILASGMRSSKYRQALVECLRWKTDDPSSLRTAVPMEMSPLAETYMLSCCTMTYRFFRCTSTFLDLPRMLLRAGANPMVQVECSPQGLDKGNQRPTKLHSFWHSWLIFLTLRRERYMEINGKSGGILFHHPEGDGKVTFNDIFDTTKALLVHGADINYQLELNNSEYLKRTGFDDEHFGLSLTCSAMFVLEECFDTEPEFREFATAMESLVTRRTRKIDVISCPGYRSKHPSAEESEMLWPLIEKWESTGHRDDLDSLQAALEVVYRTHCSDEELKESGLDSSTDVKDG
ncbi:MAG: hypothetical protein LQ338_003145 [Usnochroma carphineum]|nr:MAG: hypothetical protein LQ338_003145 [Usnochroma carphineum]